VFQAMVVLFGAAMVIMTLSPSATMMIVAQGIAGAAAAALIPTLVVLIATNYKGKQQAQPLGWLGGGHGRRVCVSGRGFLGTWIGWRYRSGSSTSSAY
jgi:MFS family permease